MGNTLAQKIYFSTFIGHSALILLAVLRVTLQQLIVTHEKALIAGKIFENETGHGQKAAALWSNTTYTKFGHIPSKQVPRATVKWSGTPSKVTGYL